MRSRKGIYFILFVALFACVTFFIIQLFSNQESSRREPIINENYIKSESFSISSVSSDLKTSAKGTLIVNGVERRPDHILIVATIEIDPNDWGGVAFYIPDKWSVANITSSYPENKPQSNPLDYVATWTSGLQKEMKWNSWIELGRDRGYETTGGGIGTVVIDLVRDKNDNHEIETFEFGVEVGSKEVEGRKLMGTDSIKIPITFVDNK